MPDGKPRSDDVKPSSSSYLPRVTAGRPPIEAPVDGRACRACCRPGAGGLHRVRRKSPRPIGARPREGEQTASLFGEHVLLVGTPVGGGHGFEDAVIHQASQPGRKNVLGQSEALLELAEPPQPVKSITDDEQRPRITDHVQRSRDGTAGSHVTGSFDHGLRPIEGLMVA